MRALLQYLKSDLLRDRLGFLQQICDMRALGFIINILKVQKGRLQNPPMSP